MKYVLNFLIILLIILHTNWITIDYIIVIRFIFFMSSCSLLYHVCLIVHLYFSALQWFEIHKLFFELFSIIICLEVKLWNLIELHAYNNYLRSTYNHYENLIIHYTILEYQQIEVGKMLVMDRDMLAIRYLSLTINYENSIITYTIMVIKN